LAWLTDFIFIGIYFFVCFFIEKPNTLAIRADSFQDNVLVHCIVKIRIVFQPSAQCQLWRSYWYLHTSVPRKLFFGRCCLCSHTRLPEHNRLETHFRYICQVNAFGSVFYTAKSI